MNRQYFVYVHYKRGTREPFYVGKGSTRTEGKTRLERSTTRSGRSSFWTAVANKYGFDVEIVGLFPTEAEAFTLERELIARFGRRKVGTGTLVNLSDGGEGPVGLVHTVEAKRKMSATKRALGRKMTVEERMAISRRQLGSKRSKEVCEKMSAAVKAKYAAGRARQFKAVINVVTGERFPSLAAVRAAYGLSHANASTHVTGNGILRPENRLPLRYEGTAESFEVPAAWTDRANQDAPVCDTHTGEVYPFARAAGEATGVNPATVRYSAKMAQKGRHCRRYRRPHRFQYADVKPLFIVPRPAGDVLSAA